MPTINQLSALDALSSNDLIPVYSATCGDARSASLNLLFEWLQEQLGIESQGFITQYAAPAATGFSIPLDDSDNHSNVHLILTPIAGYAAGTIVLPAVAGLLDGQMVLVNTTQAVTTLTISANGATAVIGAPTTLAASAFFTLKYDLLMSTWYRVG